MEDIYTTRLVRVGNSKAVVIPTEVLNALDWKRGDMLIFSFAAGDTLVIKKIKDETIKQLKRDHGISDEPVINIT